MLKNHVLKSDKRSLTPIFGNKRSGRSPDKRSLTPILGNNGSGRSPSPTLTPIFGKRRDKIRAQTPMPRGEGSTLLFGKHIHSLRRKSGDISGISEIAEGVDETAAARVTKKTRIMSAMEPGTGDDDDGAEEGAEPKWIGPTLAKGNPGPIEKTKNSRMIEVKPAEVQPTSLGIGATLWLHKFIKNTRTVNGNKLKDVDIDVKVTKNDVKIFEPAAEPMDVAVSSQPLLSPPRSGLPATGTKARRAASTKEGNVPMSPGNWADLRSRLIQAKVQEAFQSTKFTVNGATYTSLSHIGEGGYSTVYEVFNKERELFALKLVKLHDSNTTLWSDLRNEIEYLSELRNCKHVVNLVDHERVVLNGGAEEALYILMERGECDLSHILAKLEKDERLTPSKIRFYWEQMLEAVQAVHEHHFVHADIKPQNFILVQGLLKLIDFGFAARVPEGEDSLERDFVGGTKEYFSPEAMSHYVITEGKIDMMEMKRRDRRIKIGFKSDVWALGVILFQLTYGGSTPFAQVPGGKIARIQALISLEQAVDFEPIGDVALLDTMKLCLMKDPANRAAVSSLLQHPFLRPC